MTLSVTKFFYNKTVLTIWMNHLLVIYAFLLPISKYAGSFIFALILLLFALRRNFKEYLTPALTNKVVQAFILFYLIHIIWLFGTENFDQARVASNLAKYSLFPILFFSFIDRRFTHYIIGAFITGMLFSELVSYAIQLQLIPWRLVLSSIPIYEAYQSDDPSPFLHHSHYAASIAFVSALLIYKLLKTQLSSLEKIVSLFFIITISVNLSLIGGRVGYVLYLLLILFLVIYIYRKKFFKPFLIILLSVGIFFTLAYNFSPMFAKKIEQTKGMTQGFSQGKMDFSSSFGSRIGFTYYASEVIRNNPIFGVGTGDYMDVVQDIIPDTENNSWIKYHYVHPHNIYTMLLLQFGIFGLIVFFNIFYQIYRQKVDDDYLNFVKFAVVITFALALMTETFWARYYLPFFVLIISTALASNTLSSQFRLIYTPKTYVTYAILLVLTALNAKIHFIIAAIKQI